MEKLQEALKNDSNIILIPELMVLSIFDFNFYDRSDYDILTQAQRLHLEKKLKPLGYTWVSGRQLKIKDDAQAPWFSFPKPSVQGAIPSDIFVHNKRASNEILVLTPTQTACFILKQKSSDKIKELLTHLVSHHPINLKKIEDLFRVEPEYSTFMGLYSELTKIQETAVKETRLKNKSHLGRIL